ncbi:MAG TPA: malate synthase A, partial [Gaiellaceae bacterium]|nr:malate synthase A [Gaiellaceae bacterium]
RFGQRRRELLEARAARRERIAAGELPDFLPATRAVRESEWSIEPVPSGLRDRRVEITGPTDRKMVINALNSGARMFMADFEDANAPTWSNMVEGQANLTDAIERTIELETAEKTYRLNDEVATLLVRPRGWQLPERHLLVDGEPVSASLFDFGLYLFHNGRRLLDQGAGPWLYLPKLESHLEARLWNDVFSHAEDALGLDRGSIRATVLIEHVLAAFEMDEILWELREHAAGLNAGRWDYMFSVIKTFRERPEFVLPDRNAVTMTAPFMRAYTELLVRTCHRRGAHAIGGMAAFIPSRRDAELNERALVKVREDKQREAGDGFDGTWVAHPDLVSVALAEFERENQLDRLREDVDAAAGRLLDVAATPGDVTEEGLRNDVAVALRYLTAWLGGTGAVAIFNLMEDAATAEIARSQVWQWVRHGRFDRAAVERVIDEEAERFRAELGDGELRLDEAREIFEQVALGERFEEFLTLPAYDYLERG